jgi:hypothetical protein
MKSKWMQLRPHESIKGKKTDKIRAYANDNDEEHSFCLCQKSGKCRIHDVEHHLVDKPKMAEYLASIFGTEKDK